LYVSLVQLIKIGAERILWLVD